MCWRPLKYMFNRRLCWLTVIGLVLLALSSERVDRQLSDDADSDMIGICRDDHTDERPYRLIGRLEGARGLAKPGMPPLTRYEQSPVKQLAFTESGAIATVMQGKIDDQ